MDAKRSSRDDLAALVADPGGRIFDLPEYAAVGMAGGVFAPLELAETIPLPQGSELFVLPDRVPLLYHRERKRLEAVPTHPEAPDTPLVPVAAFNSPGVVATWAPAYREREGARTLPLFCYGAVGWGGGRFRAAAVRVDWEPRQDLRRMPLAAVRAGVRRLRRILPRNRLRQHLETCALLYGCPAGKNFFLGRYEAPLPTAVSCNARCLGCLSYQPEGEIPCTQERIRFTPRPEEIAAVALAHIERAPRPIVSFGQGCEGEPLTAARVIAPAIRRIREKTTRGTIHLNTNASLPRALASLCAAGLDSIRVSANSLRPACYEAYFRPRGYRFRDVLQSIDLALTRGLYVAINYLNAPGFTDTDSEFKALCRFLRRHPVQMIQWRNLNYDPLRYREAMAEVARPEIPFGMRALLAAVRREFPELKFGYFNPPREKWRERGPDPR